jgi:hypothetical protein
MRDNFFSVTLNEDKMNVKKSSKQKYTRHHTSTAPSIAKKQSTKAKLRNQDLRSQLDNITGLAGAVNLFTPSKKLQEQRKKEEAKKIETAKVVEEDMLALMAMQLSSTKAH